MKGFLLFVVSTILLHMYIDLGHILEWGFNLTFKKFAFLFERAFVARYLHTVYASKKDI